MKQVQRISGSNMMLVAADASHAEFILSLRQEERKKRFLSGSSENLAEQIAWMNQRQMLDNDAYFIIYEIQQPSQPLGTIRLHDVIDEKNSISVGSWVMRDGVQPKKTLEALSLAIEYIIRSGYSICHFEVHKASLSALRLYTKLGTQIVGETEHAYLLSCPPTLFLQNMASVYHLPQPHIQQIRP